MNTAIKNLNVRTKRAKLIAEMGLVTRDEQGFTVKSPTNHNQNLRVWRDDKGRVRCSCNDFEKLSQEDPRFRCEHILGVKYFLEPISETPETQETQEVTEISIVTKETLEQPMLEENLILTEENNVSFMKQESEQNVVSSMKQNEILTVVSPMKQEYNSTSVSSMKQEKIIEDKIMRKNPETEKIITPVLTPDLVGKETLIDEPLINNKDAFTEVLKQLSTPISRELIRQRFGWTDKSGVDHEIDYIEWHTVADLLDHIYPRWSHSVKDVRQVGELVAITASITIMGVTREGVGTGSAYDEIGIKKAEHDALKRAAVKFGVARDLYKRDDEDIAANNQTLRFPRDPVAKNIAEMATTKQHAAIRAIANAQGVDAEALCQELFNCKVAELSRRAASTFIDHLKNTKQSISA